MNYILSTQNNNYDIVIYDHAISADYRLFKEALSLQDSPLSLFYTVKKKEDLKKIKKFHWLSSTGPDLVSNEFRKVITEVAGNEVEFFDVTIMFGEEKIEGFSAINFKYIVPCLDMDKSEFKPTNFDPSDPTYRFYFMVVNSENLDVNIALCKEMKASIVVSEQLKQSCFKAGLKGLKFCNAIDMTYQERTVCEEII